MLALVLCGGLSTGLLGLELFDTAAPSEAWLRALAGLGAGVLVAWAGLGLTDVPPQDRGPGALWAVVPWYFFFASQLAYLGFILIAVEVGVGAAMLAWRTKLGAGRALSLLLAARVAIFAVHSLP